MKTCLGVTAMSQGKTTTIVLVALVIGFASGFVLRL